VTAAAAREVRIRLSGRAVGDSLPPMPIDVADAVRRGRRIGAPRNVTKAEVFLLEDAGRRVVVKTLATPPMLLRRLFGGALLRREGRMLARLRGTPGVPELIEATDETLVVEHRPGKSLFERRMRGIPPATATRIEQALAAFHASGFAHGDIGRRDVLVTREGDVSIVDFATAVGPGTPPLLWRILLPVWRWRDRARVSKLIHRYRTRWDRRLEKRARGMDRNELLEDEK
jgi:predicted Ser/Thr protein kinase